MNSAARDLGGEEAERCYLLSKKQILDDVKVCCQTVHRASVPASFRVEDELSLITLDESLPGSGRSLTLPPTLGVRKCFHFFPYFTLKFLIIFFLQFDVTVATAPSRPQRTTRSVLRACVQAPVTGSVDSQSKLV